MHLYAVMLSDAISDASGWIEFYWSEDLEHATAKAVDANPTKRVSTITLVPPDYTKLVGDVTELDPSYTANTAISDLSRIRNGLDPQIAQEDIADIDKVIRFLSFNVLTVWE